MSSQDCMNAINDNLVNSSVPKSEPAIYRCRKHYTSENVLITVNSDIKFMICASWLGRIGP